LTTDTDHLYPGWPADAPAIRLYRAAILAGHEMSPWAIRDTYPYDLPQCACAACSYWIMARPDDGEPVYTPTIWERPSAEYTAALRIVPPCDQPLAVGEDVRMRAMGQPQLFAGAV